MGSDVKNGNLIQNSTISADGLSGPAFAAVDSGAWSFMVPVIPACLDPGILAPYPGAITGATATGDTAAVPTAGLSTSGATSGVTAAGSGLNIVITYASDAQGYLGFASLQGAVNSAVSYLESVITTNITVNINVGWGTVGSYSVPTGAVGASTSYGVTTNYAALLTALQDHATSADDATAVANLPAIDPTRGGTFYIPDAQAEALGLASFGPHQIDGYVGLSTTQPYTFSQSGGISSGTYDAVGVLEHEMTEVMGRIESLGTYAASGYYTLMDLFRYSSPGVPDLAPGPGSFSIDGTTLLKTLNNPTGGGDAGDWASGGGADAFNSVATTNVVNPVSATDLRLLDVLGYTLACFAAGTLLTGEHGEIPVEHLKPGDRVRARFAGLATVKWIGQRRIDCVRHPDPLAILPVRIAAGAFGPGLPRRDLLLSPEHAVAVDGALIPIRLLLNGGSIAQETVPRPVHYFHVELDRHDLLCAEGLDAESYLDTGNRGVFANAGLPQVLHPDFDNGQARRERDSCLPMLLDAARVEPVWRVLAARAQNDLGFAPPRIDTTADPAPRLVVAGRGIKPAAFGDDRCCFVLPAIAPDARLVSRHVRPAALRPWIDDRRRLGLMIRGITLHAEDGRMTELAMDDPVLRDGWWAAERDHATLWRWTDGDAVLPLLPDIRLVELRLGQRLAYPVTQDGRAAERCVLAAMRAA